jgi:hypothetical protein
MKESKTLLTMIKSGNHNLKLLNVPAWVALLSVSVFAPFFEASYSEVS